MALREVDGEEVPVPRPRTPADVWVGLLRRLGRGLGARPITVKGVRFRLEELDFGPDGSAWSFGRLRDVRAVATDVGYEGIVADRVVAECDEVSLRSVATASAITLTATLSPANVQAVLDASGSRVRLLFVDGELRLPWGVATELVVEPEVDDEGTITFRTGAVRSFGQRVELPAWLPTATTVRPALPAGIRLLAVGREGPGDGGSGDGIVVRAVLDEPAPVTLERRHVRELMAASRRGHRTVLTPPA